MTGLDQNINIASLNRSEILQILSDSVKIVGGKVTAQRVKPGEGDDLRLKYARALAQLATPLLAAIRDTQLDEITRDIELLKTKQGLK